MIVGAAVCPGAPFLVPGVADRLAAQSADLIAACGAAVRGLAGADRIVQIAAGRRTVLYPPDSVAVTASPLARSDLGPGRCGPDLAVGSIVGRALLDRAFPDGVPLPVSMVETADDPASTSAAVRRSDPGRDALLVIADGAAAHGDHAPAPRDDRSAEFDDALASALGAGDPHALRSACDDHDLADRLLAVTGPLEVLAELTGPNPPSGADLLYRGAPYGVGYLVASWWWPAQ